ncbi:MAG: MEDS domain-containing protein [Streptosporangiaceae bacterium]|nr:MEDS domain-containing protein [Streptosporangiaceae bacterium]MBV9855391.1 MEDS domain-containing protein [Streptosporangiaceae bacterium]
MDILPDGAIRAVRLDGHVCWLVSAPGMYAQAAPELLAEGQRLGQMCVVFAPGREPADVAGGRLDPAQVLRAVTDARNRASAEGFSGVRILADMDWLLPARPTTGDIVRLELMLDRLLTAEPDVTVVCAYRSSSFDTGQIAAALVAHPVVSGPVERPQFRFVAGTAEWLLSGEVDARVRDVFEDVIRAALAHGPQVIDVSELDFIDVSGVRAVVTGGRSDGGIVLKGVSPALRRLWEVSGFARSAPMVRLTDDRTLERS